MIQIIPIRWIAAMAAWFGGSMILLLGWAVPTFGGTDRLRWSVLAVNGCLLLFTVKPVWRFVWRQVPGLSQWFPDLNGHYDVELRTNWPIQERVLRAAGRKEDSFDPFDTDTVLPPLGTRQLGASIDLGFYSVLLRMWDENGAQSGSVISESRTLTTSLLRPCDGKPHRLVYVYQQRNRRDRHALTDDILFDGAAIVEVCASKPNVSGPEGQGATGERTRQSPDELELVGEYWTNRGWDRGLGSAGTIVLRRRSE